MELLKKLKKVPIASLGRGFPKWILILGGGLLLLRLLLPFICLKGINYALNEYLGEYRGHIEDFDLALYRGAYQIEGLVIEKRKSGLPPLLKVKALDISLAWRSLFRGEISGDIGVRDLQLRLFDAKDPGQKQSGLEEDNKNWQDTLDLLIPVSIESLKVSDSKIYFTNSDITPPIPVSLEKIELSARDLRTTSQSKLSPFQITALLQKNTRLHSQGKLDLMAKPMRLDLEFKMENLPISSLNPQLLSYVPMDITKGELSVYSEFAFSHDKGKGYLKLFLKDSDVLAPKQKFVSVKHFFLEILGAFANWLLENGDSGKVATIIPIEYDATSLNINTSEAFWSAVRNMWDKIHEGIDDSISLHDLEKNLRPPTSPSKN